MKGLPVDNVRQPKQSTPTWIDIERQFWHGHSGVGFAWVMELDMNLQIGSAKAEMTVALNEEEITKILDVLADVEQRAIEQIRAGVVSPT